MDVDMTRNAINIGMLDMTRLHNAITRKRKTKETRNVGQCPTWWPPCRI